MGLLAVDGPVRLEGRGRNAGGDALLRRPGDGGAEVAVAAGKVREARLRRSRRKGRSDRREVPLFLRLFT